MGNDHPDSNVYPSATAAAWQMVKAHEKEKPLKLYSGWFCPFVQRVLLVLIEKNIPFQYIEVNPYHKPQSLLSLNPRGLVPTLEYDNKPLYESTVICEFLEDAYPSATPKLIPSDPYTKARMRIWIDFVTSRIIPSFHRFLQYQPKSASDLGLGNKNAFRMKQQNQSEPFHSDPGLHRARLDFHSQLSQFTNEMDPEGLYFLGPEISLIDLVIAPWAVRLWVFDHFKEGLKLPQEAKWVQRWKKWLSAIEKRESVVSTTSDREHYLPIYQRYADDTAQSELAKATREGKGVP